ncbi:MAG: nucleotidyl transferase AbiEii/AbiGii toxin family protein [Saprospiraceae bacterium]
MTIQAIDPFFLVGGTALALQFGHRTSIDIDLFTTNEFRGSELIDSLNNRHLNLTIVSEKPSMLITYINNVKVDFVKMGYPILFEPLTDNGIRMLDIRDIAPMKLKAIAQRGSKKDFYDVYFLLNKLTLEEMLNLFKEKFKQHEVFHIVKSLTYFEDAEQYADPMVFHKNITWPFVKSEIRKAVNDFLK